MVQHGVCKKKNQGGRHIGISPDYRVGDGLGTVSPQEKRAKKAERTN